jgi:hypothetical protein
MLFVKFTHSFPTIFMGISLEMMEKKYTPFLLKSRTHIWYTNPFDWGSQDDLKSGFICPDFMDGIRK